ncbi:hypothetical protein R3P38DRAFT_2771124 [Favolaschia claudopus]|uniref:Uncharacterized protein n=1 Tax=Favolaschia claudopus TaxID=2862362 RepID=A0AAW0CDT1_9AGAR
MLDEIAIEGRPRYDDRTNMVVGVCRQHGHKLPLELGTEDDLNVLCKGIKDGKAHLAREATVAALGLLTPHPRLYAARPILFSADCKRESGPEHAVNILHPLKRAIKNKSQQGNTTYRAVCFASDGEGRRGKALVIEFMNRELNPESPIHPLLSGLEFMNLLVGEDDITPDKDAKHVLKCLRNLTMRDAGIKIRGFSITLGLIKEHLRRDEFLDKTIRAFLNPRDRQDELPDPPHDSSPSFSRGREALQIFGRLGYYLMMPYVNVDLDLSAQLTYLSAAAHLLMDLYAHDSARTDFMPAQTYYVNIMMMIKNAYFCVAKTKVDIPEGKFWLILLGTDRLEIFYGLLRSAIGPDSNVDLLQLANRASGLAEIAAGEVLDSRFDASWRGDVDVRNVTLLTCWVRGRELIEDFIPATREVFERMAAQGVDIFSPCGKPLLEAYDEEDIEAAYAALTVEAKYPAAASEEILQSEPTYAGEDDIEDAMAVEEPRGGFETHLTVNGSNLTKAKALRLAMAGLIAPRASTDRTKRVASIPCHEDTGIYDEGAPILGGPCLRIENPICVLVRCEERLFLSIGAINRMSWGSEKVQEISIDMLADGETKISFEMMCLVRTTVEDDPTERYDWRWSRDMDNVFFDIPGRLVQPINPTVSVRGSKPTYLFESPNLMVFASTLLERLKSADIKHLPTTSRTKSFPYRIEGKACFLCEHDTNDRSVDLDPPNCCQKCNPPVALNVAHPQRILEHNGAHLLYDPHINRQHEYCGLCLRPAQMCTFFLRRPNGNRRLIGRGRPVSGRWTSDMQWQQSQRRAPRVRMCRWCARSADLGNQLCGNIGEYLRLSQLHGETC